MGMNRTPVSRAMKYWRVGFGYTTVIRARTARVAVRKWLRDNSTYDQLIRDYELDNPGGSGEMPHEIAAVKSWHGFAAARTARLEVKDIPVEQVPKGWHGSSAPQMGSFWSGFNRPKKRS